MRVKNLKGPWQAVTILVHRLSEIDTPAFHQFLDQAVASFEQNLKNFRMRPEDVMPWKVNGERWHLSEKGFPIGRRIAWDRSILPYLLDLVRDVEPEVQVNWNARDCISFRVPGSSRTWAQWRTKQANGLDCRFLGKKGQFNLSQIEEFGHHPCIRSDRKDGDVLCFEFREQRDIPPQEWKEFLRQQLAGFREAFGNGS
ncbi:MAG: hypothetical protein KatS3mg105_1481 [Gemmatales bacterium]|nr:MAG: hypothetical protein KatS3mg105_1481 [Gemmatales bacterium]